ncbi:uncharacterized protein LOC132757110 [Ruditapes philippinarum]|uniref:uncharacterized protein LOC132757110 n=1 Tax=Ruditapes philippinarum TaxID=129788 RepID=UPI00295A7970|nr:uncharacterized protein LOC132757110 [Ruditapes philippinarum]
METILNNIECRTVKTPMQYNSNKILKEIDQHKYIQFCKNEYCKLSSFIEDLKINPADPVSAKNLSEFYSKVHNYQISAEFRMNCLMLFENTSIGEDHLHICFNISNEIRKYLLKKKAELFTVIQRTISRRAVSNASHARVRYVGGYYIAKIRHKYIQKKRSHMYKTDASGQALFEESVLAVSILDGLKLDEHHVISTTNEPESLLDVSRRQKGNRSLINISDELFHFFKKLTEICLSLLIDENFNKYGGNLFEHIRTEIMEKSDLYNQFCEVVDISINRNEEFDSETVNKELRNKQISNVYKKIIKLFLMVMVNQFRKDILESFNIQKKMAHRKQIRVSQTDKTKSDKGKESKKKVL